jgi:hypothetical protein
MAMMTLQNLRETKYVYFIGMKFQKIPSSVLDCYSHVSHNHTSLGMENNMLTVRPTKLELFLLAPNATKQATKSVITNMV